MPLLNIVFDLSSNNSEKNIEKIISIIKIEGNWARIAECSYVIQTTKTPSQIYEILAPYLTTSDKLLIFTIVRPYMGQHSKEIVDWLGSRV